MVPILLTIVSACALGIGASLLFTWASGRSAVWNIGFAVVLVVTVVAALMLTISLLMRRVAG
jgi:hypothetical protein